jgi:DNA polymerase elongation subunit (family B)
MSYISAQRMRDEVIVWERGENGREVVTYPAPYYFFTPDTGDGKGTPGYTSIFGDKLVRHDFTSSSEMQQARASFEAARVPMFESDIPPDLKVLCETYYQAPAPQLNVTFLDIEVDYKSAIGFSSVKNPYAEINSVAIHHRWKNQTILLLTPSPKFKGITSQELYDAMNEVEPLPESLAVEDVVICSGEVELLLTLLDEIEDTDVMCGWNSDLFDIPYIGKRLETVLGDKYFRMLSFPEATAPRWRTVEIFNVEQLLLDPQGRISVDYMQLFKKYEVAERPSYKLESISEEVLPDLRKLEYDGTLEKLYADDLPHFARYNVRDTEVLNGFEDKLAYVQLANEMYHISTGLMPHVTGTIKLAELATNAFCIHELNQRVPDNTIEDTDGGIEGACVLIPNIGMHEWIGSIDINSLYPSAIRSLNISPEKIVGQFLQATKAHAEIAKGSMVSLTFQYEDFTQDTKTADEWRDYFIEKRWAISGYGTVFDQNEKGIIPTILETWYAKRNEYKALMKTARGEGDAEKEAYYDRLQYVYKIKLNSYYGALTNAYFRYNDKRMGESTTATGRCILQHMCATACEALNGQYTLPNKTELDSNGKEHKGYTDDVCVVYGDTDSAYFRTYAQNQEEAIAIADAVGEFANRSFQRFMRENFLCTDGFDDIIAAGREVVASRGIFVQKKRYILRVVDDEGKAVDKLKVMGLDTKKTTLPVAISKVLNEFVGRLLKGESWDDIARDIVDFKTYIRTTDDIVAIGIPKGIKGIEEYTAKMQVYGDGQRLPGHVAAAIHYNECLKQYNDHDSMPITSGMKIRVFYLARPIGRYKSIALPTDADFVPKWFLDNYPINREMHVERLVDNPLKNIITAIGYGVPSAQSLLVDDLLEF